MKNARANGNRAFGEDDVTAVLHAGSLDGSSEPLRKITLSRVIDSEIRPSRTSPGMYELPFEISTLPESAWVNAFRQACEEVSQTPKRAVRLAGMRITVTLEVGDDQQRIADNLKDIVKEANTLCWAAWQREGEDQASRLEELRVLDARLHRLQSEARRIEL